MRWRMLELGTGVCVLAATLHSDVNPFFSELRLQWFAFSSSTFNPDTRFVKVHNHSVSKDNDSLLLVQALCWVKKVYQQSGNLLCTTLPIIWTRLWLAPKKPPTYLPIGI